MKQSLVLTLIALFLAFTPALLAAEAETEVDPIFEVSLFMKQAAHKLADLNTGKPTQTKQQQAVDKLDLLIAQLEKECEKCKGGQASGANPSKPLNDSVIRGGPGGSGDLHSARKNGRDWGDLPPHERDRILQSLTEGFPAHYQNLLENYYKRIAEEKPLSAETADEKDKAAANKPSSAKSGSAEKAK